MEKLGFVFIHGAGLGGWAWEKVRAGLKLPSIAPDLPGRGDTTLALRSVSLEEYVQSVADAVRGFDAEKLILVGHSAGGMIALRLATLMPQRIAAIVFVGAVFPRSGKPLVSTEPWQQRLFTRFILGFLPPKPPLSVIKAALCNDLDAAACKDLISRYSPESPRLFLDRVAWSIPAELPRFYVRTLKDMSVPFPLQDKMIDVAHPDEVFMISSGHLPMLSKPDELRTILESIASLLTRKTGLA